MNNIQKPLIFTTYKLIVRNFLRNISLCILLGSQKTDRFYYTDDIEAPYPPT